MKERAGVKAAGEAAYNETTAPFNWQRCEVYQASLHQHYADLRS